MARWNPDSGVSPNRAFVLASDGLHQHFWSEWAAIDRRYPHDLDENLALMRDSARRALRNEVQQMVALGGGGRRVIPV